MFDSITSLLSPRVELSSLSRFGANDAELAVDDTEVQGTIIARRSNPAVGDRHYVALSIYAARLRCAA